MCPRLHIKEDPEWWNALVEAHNHYKKGFLPHAGGMSDQPALFAPIMSLISSALDDEKQIEAEKTKERDRIIEEQKKRRAIDPSAMSSR